MCNTKTNLHCLEGSMLVVVEVYSCEVWLDLIYPALVFGSVAVDQFLSCMPWLYCIDPFWVFFPLWCWFAPEVLIDGCLCCEITKRMPLLCWYMHVINSRCYSAKANEDGCVRWFVNTCSCCVAWLLESTCSFVMQELLTNQPGHQTGENKIASLFKPSPVTCLFQSSWLPNMFPFKKPGLKYSNVSFWLGHDSNSIIAGFTQ